MLTYIMAMDDSAPRILENPTDQNRITNKSLSTVNQTRTLAIIIPDNSLYFIFNYYTQDNPKYILETQVDC